MIIWHTDKRCHPTCLGWDVFDCGDRYEIQRCDECNRYPDDEAAAVALQTFVRDARRQTRILRAVVVVLLMEAIVGCALYIALARRQMPAAVDSERTGAEVGYVHGAHCIDGRAF